MGQPGDTARSFPNMGHLHYSNYYVTLGRMAQKTPAAPDAAVEVYVTQGIDGTHNVALRFTTLNSSYVIAMPTHVALDLRLQLPNLLGAAAEEATKLNNTPRLVTPNRAEQALITRKRD